MKTIFIQAAAIAGAAVMLTGCVSREVDHVPATTAAAQPTVVYMQQPAAAPATVVVRPAY